MGGIGIMMKDDWMKDKQIKEQFIFYLIIPHLHLYHTQAPK